MKKFILGILLMFAIVKVQAQNYLISFAGTGDTTVVNTVKIENLTSGATVTLNGSDILHLVPTLGVDFRNRNNNHLTLYPSPLTDHARLTFATPEKGEAVIGIFDLSGKPVYQFSMFLPEGENTFQISGIYQGIYLLKITGRSFLYSTKLISHCQPGIKPEIVFVSNNLNPATKSTAATIDMKYTDGDQLLLTGISGKYGTVVADVPAGSKTITFNLALCQDHDGNNYKIVQIGTQTWMAENLNVGIRINGTQEQTDNGLIEKYCYNDSISNCTVYGGLYQWNEVMQYVSQEGTQGICPAGWHLPTNAEWTILTNYLGGDSLTAGGNLKSTGTIQAGTGLWWGDNTGATNNSGFTSLPGGYRAGAGYFTSLSQSASLWTSSYFLSGTIVWVWARDLSWDSERVSRYWNTVYSGFSVRCLKN